MNQRPEWEPTSWGTQRRLQALTSRGWSPHAIQRVTGIPAADIAGAIRDRRETWQSLDRRVAAAYNLLWNRQPPRARARDQAQADTARAQAEMHGWAPPMAWDDDIIDLPHGEPAPGWQPSHRSHHRSADLVEDANWIREHGGYRNATMRQVAVRLGVTREVLAKAHERVADREAEAG
jgi:hypothetical protein